MGRRTSLNEWAHFERVTAAGRVPNSSYWFVRCRHCTEAHAQQQLPNAPAEITGRGSAMRAHLRLCPVYGGRYNAELAAAASDEGAASGDAAGEENAPTAMVPLQPKRKQRDGDTSGPRACADGDTAVGTVVY